MIPARTFTYRDTGKLLTLTKKQQLQLICSLGGTDLLLFFTVYCLVVCVSSAALSKMFSRAFMFDECEIFSVIERL